MRTSSRLKMYWMAASMDNVQYRQSAKCAEAPSKYKVLNRRGEPCTPNHSNNLGKDRLWNDVGMFNGWHVRDDVAVVYGLQEYKNLEVTRA